MNSQLTISLSPHIHSGNSVKRCMWTVVVALIPTLAVSLWVFGWNALWVILLSCAACLLTEWCIDRFLFKRDTLLGNGSALITGLLLACNLPSIIPWWMVIIGGVVAIGIGKMSFGGLGCNIWNPALVGRVFLLISFPAAMTTWAPDVASGVDGLSGATFLTALNNTSNPVTLDQVNLLSLGMGNMNGSLGEVGSIAILIGLVILLATRVISWHIPVSVIAGAAIMSAALGCNPLLDILAGGLLLGAVFMATDYVTSPMTHKGQIIYGLMIGIITIIIRRFGSYPEGVSFAILLMNSFVPLINHYFPPRRYGERSKK
jgi:electron transport complex protein RnfD